MNNEFASFSIGGVLGAILVLFLLSGPAYYINVFYKAGYNEGMLSCLDSPEACQKINDIRKLEKSLQELKNSR